MKKIVVIRKKVENKEVDMKNEGLEKEKVFQKKWTEMTDQEKFETEFKKGQLKYENDNRSGKFDHMDLQTFMWNLYEQDIQRLRERQAMWSTESLQKYLSQVKE